MVYVGLVNGKWRTKSKVANGVTTYEIFYVVVVCNGHETEPRTTEILGINAWPGK